MTAQATIWPQRNLLERDHSLIYPFLCSSLLILSNLAFFCLVFLSKHIIVQYQWLEIVTNTTLGR